MIMLFVCFILLIAFVAGFLLLKGVVGHSDIDVSVLVPLSMSIGLSFLVIVLMLLSLIYIDYVVCFAIVVLLALGLARYLKRGRPRLSSVSSVFGNYRLMLSLILIIISIWRFSYIVENWGWAPLADSITHGTWISIIQYQNQIPLTTYPVSDLAISPLRYPMGFHLLGAFFSYIVGLYPGQIVVVLGTCFVSLLPLIMYSIVFLSTRSHKLSLVAFLVSFFLPGGEAMQWSPSHDLLLGNFIVGTYPNLLGNLILLTIIAIEVFFDHNGMNATKKPRKKLQLLMALSLCLCYYALVPFVILYFVLSELTQQFKNDRRNLKRAIPIMVIILGYILSVVVRTSLTEFLHYDSAFYFELYHAKYAMFTMDSIYLTYSVLMLVAVPIAIWVVLKKQRCSAEIFFLALAVPVLLSQSREFYMEFLWFVQMDRLLIVAVAATYIVIIKNFSLVANKLTKTFTTEFYGKQREVRSREFVQAISLVVVFILLVPSFLGHATYVYEDNFQKNLPHDGDLDCMKWLSANVRSEDLILNDILTISWWLTTFKALKVVNSRQVIFEVYLYMSQNNTLLGNRTRECNEILAYPWDYDLLERMADKYDLKYIYISQGNLSVGISARGRSLVPALSSHNITQETRLALYGLNPNLEVAYQSGNATVYRITNHN